MVRSQKCGLIFLSCGAKEKKLKPLRNQLLHTLNKQIERMVNIFSTDNSTTSVIIWQAKISMPRIWYPPIAETRIHKTEFQKYPKFLSGFLRSLQEFYFWKFLKISMLIFDTPLFLKRKIQKNRKIFLRNSTTVLSPEFREFLDFQGAALIPSNFSGCRLCYKSIKTDTQRTTHRNGF